MCAGCKQGAQGILTYSAKWWTQAEVQWREGRGFEVKVKSKRQRTQEEAKCYGQIDQNVIKEHFAQLFSLSTSIQISWCGVSEIWISV